MTENTFKEAPAEKAPETQPAVPVEEKETKSSKSRNVIFDLLGGEFLAYKWVRRQFSYVLFLALMALFYIANIYYAESMNRDIDRLHRELKELHFEYISSKSELMHQTKQSVLAIKLKDKGIKESVEPVNKIVIHKKAK